MPPPPPSPAAPPQPPAAPPPDIAIEARGLKRRFGDVLAVDGFTASVAVGEVFGMVGPDGAGKSSTLRMLAGMLDASAGTAHVGGHDVARGGAAIGERIGYVPQRFGLYADLTVAENLRFFADLRGLPREGAEARMGELLGFVGLAEFTGRLAGALSGGMKQKLALACALIHVPPVLLLDEPTNGVDPVSRRDFWRLLYRLVREQRTTIMVATAYLDEAERCDRVALMHGGRVRALDTPAGLKALVPGQLLELRPPDARRAAATLRPHFPPGAVGLFGDRVHLLAPDAAAAEAAAASLLAASGGMGAVRPIAPTLEDVFVALLGTPEAADGAA